jgi:hypothetical protein
VAIAKVKVSYLADDFKGDELSLLLAVSRGNIILILQCKEEIKVS